jgi:hypothetical protein
MEKVLYGQSDKKLLPVVFRRTKFRNVYQCENLAVLYCVKLQHFLCGLCNHGSAFIIVGYTSTNSAADMGICMHDCAVWERGHVCMRAAGLGVRCGL